MENKIINYEALEDPIVKIEDVLNDFDPEEKQLILKYITQRILKEIQKLQVKEAARTAMSGLSLKDMMKSFKKDKDSD